MKKRILIFSTAYFPFVGGAEVAIKEITDGLEEFEFDMITARMQKDLLKVEKIGNVTVYRIGIGNKTFDKFFLALCGGCKAKKLHKKNSYSALWSMMASYGGFAALSTKKKTNLPFLLTLQEGDPIEYILQKVRFVRNRFNQIFTSADGLEAISSYLLHWGEQMGFRGKVKEIVPNGVDVSRFTNQYSDEEIQETRKNFGFEKNAHILVTASRLVVKNGVEDVIRSLVLLPQNVCFVICGVGELEPSLRILVQELGLEKRVRFLGNVSHNELPKILKASDIFIRPSITEGLGNSFLEAMAVGLPTIGTPVGGIPDFLIDGETGFFCKVKNPESIAETVLKIGSLSKEQKEIIHKNAMKKIEETYNWTTIRQRMKHIFETLTQ